MQIIIGRLPFENHIISNLLSLVRFSWLEIPLLEQQGRKSDGILIGWLFPLNADKFAGAPLRAVLGLTHSVCIHGFAIFESVKIICHPSPFEVDFTITDYLIQPGSSKNYGLTA